MEKHKHKLSTHRGAAHSRLWFEGARLIEAGFTHGERFSVTWTPATVTLRIVPHFEGRMAGFGKVAGTSERPIVDIAGGPVFETFGKHADHVSVTYGAGEIIVRRAGA